MSVASSLIGVSSPGTEWTGVGTYAVPDSIASQIPSIAYSVPDLEAVARLTLYDNSTDTTAACIQATLSNGLSTRQTAVAYATGFFTLLCLVVGLWHSALLDSPSPAQYRWYDVLFLYQTAAASGLLHLNYPEVYLSFTQNFAWALGLITSSSIQSSLDTMRSLTGGVIEPDSTSETVNTAFSPYNSAGLATAKRAVIETVIDTDTSVASASGIMPYLRNAGVEPLNAMSTVFLVFLMFLAVAIVVHIVLFIIVAIGDSGSSIWATRMRRVWWDWCGGSALRVVGLHP